MSKFLYVLYGGALLIGSLCINVNYAAVNSGPGSGWVSQGGGTYWGGSGGSTGGFFSGGGHK
jgi:hypothetical protein